MYNRESNIMRKLLGKSVTDSSTGDLSASAVTTNSSAPSTSTAPAAPYRPSKSQDGVYAAGSPISCLDVSPDRRAVVLAGPHVLKTIVLDDPTTFDFRFTEGTDLRAAILAQPQPATGSKPSVISDQLNIRDVKWHGNSMVFTACASGRVFAYDVNRIGACGDGEPLEYIHMQEDSRQVNSLDFNPHLKSWLLTGSQDGLARVFDAANATHTRSGFLTFRQRFAALRCIDSIRQVKWSPRVGHEMACCTDSGVILKWDVRNPARPLLRINAHEKACTGISWHPDGIHLISGGSDAKLHVWDLGRDADRRQKPKYTISTPAPVAAVAWRPGLWSATAQSRRVAQVACAYDDRRYGTSAVHIWDLARPTMPYKEIERFDSSPSALTWMDQDMLWTVGQDHMFNQCDVAYAPRTIDRQPTSAMAFSPRGDVVMFLDERPQQQRQRSTPHERSELIPRNIYNSSPNTPRLSVSRSDSEEDVLGTFLTPRRRRYHKRHGSTRQSSTLSSTPPSSIPENTRHVMGLDQGIKITGIFKSQQTMASGLVPAAKTVQVYNYLSSVYLETLEKELPHVNGGPSLVQRVTSIMAQYAAAAETASLFRLAQTWRILSFAVSLLLKRRAAYHVETRVTRFQKQKLAEKNQVKNGADSDGTPKASSSSVAASADSRFLGRSLLAEEIDSTSNMPTPLARPADDSNYQNHSYQYGKKLTPIVEPESFSLGPAVHNSYNNGGSPRRRLDSMPISFTSQESEQSQLSSTEGYDFYDTENLMHAIDVPSPGNRRSWRADVQKPSEPRKKTARQDSQESYGQVFSLSEGTKQANSALTGSAFPPVKQSPADGSESNSTEYESRIRGEQMHNSPSRPPRSAPLNDSPEEVFLISQTTQMSDETYPSQTSFASQTDSDAPLYEQPPTSHPAPTPKQNRVSSPAKAPSPAQYDSRPHIIESDYLPWPNDRPYPHPLVNEKAAPVPPLDPYVLITRALDFESRTSALNSSAIILLLKPLVPDSVIDTHRANAVLRQQHDRLMRMSLFVEATLLRNLCVQGWPDGIPEWGDGYPAIFGPAQRNVKVSFACPSCHKPRERDPADPNATIWVCERCQSIMGPCAICGHREPEMAAHDPVAETNGNGTGANELDHDRSALSSEWWYCPGCAHGGHASCLGVWHAVTADDDAYGPATKYSGGCCPLDGCGHACLPGRYRGETATQRAEEIGRAAVESSRSSRDAHAHTHTHTHSQSGRSSPRGMPPGSADRHSGASVRSDANDVPQSRAVGVAREALKGGGGSSTGGILSSSPGRATERERRKSVKFAKQE